VAGGFAPVRFLQEVRAEVGRVTWPSRRETAITTGFVLLLSALTALFFFVVDQVFGYGVHLLFAGA
jgi:preprotein translocase subunit SecE